MDSRQLKVYATCFDLSVSLLRVLEMTITLVPEIFSTGPGQPLRCCCGARTGVSIWARGQEPGDT